MQNEFDQEIKLQETAPAIKEISTASDDAPIEGEMKFEIESFLRLAVKQGVSDIHLRVNSVPVVRKDGHIMKTKYAVITEETMESILNLVVPSKLQHKIKTSYDFDFSIEMPEIARFRVNYLKDYGRSALALRVVPIEIPSIEELYLPPTLRDFLNYKNGLVLVTGPTGSGKSTTLATILDYLNNTSNCHVLTLEDPIEFVHKNKKCVFTQRQLGSDTDSFPNALKFALRQDPDIILIGEMRDRETISSALKAAETGHLVFSTLHTTDAVQTINRIINSFEPHEREAIREQLANILRGTIAQKLLKKKDGKGRVPATEVLVITPTARDYIRRNEIENLYTLIDEGNFSGMMSMNASIYKLVKANLITPEVAVENSNNPNEMKQMLQGVFHGTREKI
ncbi:MAG: type IV pilus twitching motility protein PilT [Candidatus Gastranaerophilales bacterium]|jgi:twitching motility protein PilT|nr:type IV pilus twitching motility protein PilT [Candidatus Gastranaerophilales bacterium]